MITYQAEQCDPNYKSIESDTSLKAIKTRKVKDWIVIIAIVIPLFIVVVIAFLLLVKFKLK